MKWLIRIIAKNVVEKGRQQMAINLQLVIVFAMCCCLTGACRRGAEGQVEPPRAAAETAVEEGMRHDESAVAEAGDEAQLPVTEERAREIASDHAQDEGYDLSVYPITSCNLTEDGAWYWVDFEHLPPTPPGAHFGVRVNVATGEPDLVHGE